ncbi:hypothetical protein J6590_045057 [Homalodisca vitripennis]|nr:hypothetical protein J6590_045057 [Homalodisca vitripennis]
MAQCSGYNGYRKKTSSSNTERGCCLDEYPPSDLIFANSPLALPCKLPFSSVTVIGNLLYLEDNTKQFPDKDMLLGSPQESNQSLNPLLSYHRPSEHPCNSHEPPLSDVLVFVHIKRLHLAYTF